MEPPPRRSGWEASPSGKRDGGYARRRLAGPRLWTAKALPPARRCPRPPQTKGNARAAELRGRIAAASPGCGCGRRRFCRLQGVAFARRRPRKVPAPPNFADGLRPPRRAAAVGGEGSAACKALPSPAAGQGKCPRRRTSRTDCGRLAGLRLRAAKVLPPARRCPRPPRAKESARAAELRGRIAAAEEGLAASPHPLEGAFYLRNSGSISFQPTRAAGNMAALAAPAALASVSASSSGQPRREA